MCQDFAAADRKCPDYVREGYNMIDSLAGTGESGELINNATTTI